MGPLRRDLYAIDIDRERNCYACGEFRHMARNCRNRRMRNRIEESRRLEYGQGDNRQNNLNGERDLILLN